MPEQKTKAAGVKLAAPAGVTHASFDGEHYVVEKGHVDVPLGAVAPLLAHGFERAEDKAARDAAEKVARDAAEKAAADAAKKPA